MPRRRRPTARAVLAMVLAVAAAASVAALIALLGDQPRPPDLTRAPASEPAAASAPPAPHRAVRATDCPPSDTPHLVSAEDREFLPWVRWKYRYLLDDVHLTPCRREELERVLTARERLARPATSAQPASLDEIDRQVRGLVPDAAQAYDELRNSDSEQRRLDDYANGIQHVAPLTDEQKRAVLAAKLRRKGEFESAMREAGLDRTAMSADERARAHELVQEALNRYRDDFLLDASELLDEEQLVHLSNYETTEFEQELERLRTALGVQPDGS